MPVSESVRVGRSANRRGHGFVRSFKAPMHSRLRCAQRVSRNLPESHMPATEPPYDGYLEKPLVGISKNLAIRWVSPTISPPRIPSARTWVSPKASPAPKKESKILGVFKNLPSAGTWVSSLQEPSKGSARTWVSPNAPRLRWVSPRSSPPCPRAHQRGPGLLWCARQSSLWKESGMAPTALAVMPCVTVRSTYRSRSWRENSRQLHSAARCSRYPK